MRPFRLAAGQIAPTLGDLEKNLALHEKTARDAIAQSANLVVFPELSLTGYFLKDQVPSVALRPDAPALRLFRELSQRCNVKYIGTSKAILPTKLTRSSMGQKGSFQ